MSALIAHPDVRGKINFGIIWQQLKKLLRELGSDYVLVNGYMDSHAHILYAGLGFKPLTPPLHVDFILARDPNIQPIAMPMLASVRDGVELPPCVLDLELSHVKGY